LKFKAVAEKTAKDSRGLLYFAAPCMFVCNSFAVLPRDPCCSSSLVNRKI